VSVEGLVRAELVGFCKNLSLSTTRPLFYCGRYAIVFVKGSNLNAAF